MLSLSFGVTLNAALLALLLTLHSRPHERLRDPDASIISMTAQAVPKAATLPEIIFPRISVEKALPAPQTKGAYSLDTCAILESVAKAIVADRTTVDAIVHAPADTRSIADAIVVWNVGWSADAVEIGAPLETVRTNVVATLKAAPEDCLSLPISGPRLVPVPNGDRTLFLVFGSGDWSWKSLIEPMPVETAGETTGPGFL